MADLHNASYSISRMNSDELLSLILEIRRQRRSIADAALARRAQRASKPGKPSKKQENIVNKLSLAQVQEMLSKLEDIS